MTLDARDAITRRHWPVVPIPCFTELEPLAENSHRLLLGRDTVALEIRRPWLHAVLDLCESEGLALETPYGDVDTVFETAFDWNAHAFPLIGRFIDEARAAAPNEHAAWLVWNAPIGKLEYVPLVPISTSSGGISYHRPPLAFGLSLAIDLHSHGHLGAFFSATDDEDDHGSVKIAGVVGSLDSPLIGWTFRICALGLTRELDINASASCRVCGCTEEHACELGCYWVRPGLCSRCA